MPYIIHTKRRISPDPIVHPQLVSRRAVATLEECVTALVDAVNRQDFTGTADTARGAALYAARRPITVGTIGPLPDGTVIEVARVEWQALVDALDRTALDPMWASNAASVDSAKLIDAYNARQLAER